MRILRLPSNPRSVAKIEEFVKGVCQRHRLKAERHGDMLISLTEAVTNAIIHGNKRDESKEVRIQLSKQPNCIAVKVSDQGLGFDYNNLPDPTSPENKTKCGGRGVYLMRRLCDQVEYQDNGRTVEMRFKI
ncbi:MAG TPA: ATP-binding protein [Saprospiraceae bacterium]|nr:ATP-binding protein [Saprospiraceae bacterium]